MLYQACRYAPDVLLWAYGGIEMELRQLEYFLKCAEKGSLTPFSLDTNWEKAYDQATTLAKAALR